MDNDNKKEEKIMEPIRETDIDIARIDKERFKAYLKKKGMDIRSVGEVVNRSGEYFYKAFYQYDRLDKALLELLAIKCGDTLENFMEEVKPLPPDEKQANTKAPDDYRNTVMAIKDYLESIYKKVTDVEAAVELWNEVSAAQSKTETDRARRFLESRFRASNSIAIDQDETLYAADAVGISREYLRVAREDLGVIIQTKPDGKQLWCKTNR